MGAPSTGLIKAFGTEMFAPAPGKMASFGTKSSRVSVNRVRLAHSIQSSLSDTQALKRNSPPILLVSRNKLQMIFRILCIRCSQFKPA